MQKTERRFFRSCEVRAESAGGKVYLQGYAAVFKVRSHDLGGWREIIEPNAFDDVLSSSALDCKHLVNHDPDKLLGTTRGGTLTLKADSKGLAYRTLAPSTSYGQDLITLCLRNDVGSSSFAFRIDPSGESWSDIEDPDNAGGRCALRTISKVAELVDVSTLTGPPPAYPETSAGVVNRALPESMPAKLRARLQRSAEDDDKCECDCDECLAGDCDQCDPETCQDPENCRCQERSALDAGDSKVTRVAEELFAAIADLDEAGRADALQELAAIAAKHGLEIGGNDTDDDDDGEANRARRLAVELETW